METHTQKMWGSHLKNARLGLDRSQRRLALFLFVPPTLFLLVLHVMSAMGVDVFAAVILFIPFFLLGSIGLFLWFLFRTFAPWGYFRVWLYGHLGFFWIISLPMLLRYFILSRKEGGTLLRFWEYLLWMPIFSVLLVLGSWFVFGFFKKGIGVVAPSYYKTTYYWGGKVAPGVEEGGLTLAGGEKNDGALSLGDVEGKLSLTEP